MVRRLPGLWSQDLSQLSQTQSHSSLHCAKRLVKVIDEPLLERGSSLSSGQKQLLEIQAAYRTAYGSHRRREIVLWQKVIQPKGLIGLFTREIPKEYKTPGRWMLDALEIRDQWHSRLLRTSSWSPSF